jgi:hypothetical protein
MQANSLLQYRSQRCVSHPQRRAPAPPIPANHLRCAPRPRRLVAVAAHGAAAGHGRSADAQERSVLTAHATVAMAPPTVEVVERAPPRQAPHPGSHTTAATLGSPSATSRSTSSSRSSNSDSQRAAGAPLPDGADASPERRQLQPQQQAVQDAPLWTPPGNNGHEPPALWMPPRARPMIVGRPAAPPASAASRHGGTGRGVSVYTGSWAVSGRARGLLRRAWRAVQ